MRRVVFSVFAILVFAACAFAQDRKSQLGIGGGPYILFGDVTVDEGGDKKTKPLMYEIVLNNLGGLPADRQYVSSGGRYQFINLAAGQYVLLVLLDHEEVARMRVEILSGGAERVRQNIELAWKGNGSSKPGTVSASDFYKRTEANEKLFVTAREATDQKRYDDAIATLRQLLAADSHDFQAWAELGTLYLFKQNLDESENAYVKSVTERPQFFLGQMNLGRVRVVRKNFEGAIEPLTKAVEIQPSSADANYYLGESYLQIKKGSKAVGYLNEAIKLDPVGRADAHLRLATLYNAAGMKDLAALEYEQFLKKKPDYPDRKKLEDYITANK
ncbi:MAG TPA: tetratricopeptide repeat protein, partial [Pyrinomonadaceae bacterium]|nr:tetratricopeptide repeat protein [Pyrinomonadaceae bacterium]